MACKTRSLGGGPSADTVEVFDWCVGDQGACAQAFLQGYQAVRPLGAVEHDLLLNARDSGHFERLLRTVMRDHVHANLCEVRSS
jgi:hypothetical protein